MITLTRRQARCLRGVLRRSALGIARTGPVAPLVLARRRAADSARDIGTAASPSSTPRPAPAPTPASSPCRWRRWPTSRAATRRPSPSRPPARARPGARWADRGVPGLARVRRPRDRGRSPSSPTPPDAWHESPAGAARRPGRGVGHGRRGLAPLRPGLPPAPRRPGRGRRHRRPPAPRPGRLRLPLAGRPARRPLPGLRPARAAPRRRRRRRPGRRPRRPPRRPLDALARDPDRRPLPRRRPRPAGRRRRPRPGCASTRPTPAFLADALGRLPGADDDGRPGHARPRRPGRRPGAGRGRARRPSWSWRGRPTPGPPARVAMNRAYLARAARLGFVEVEVAGPDAPLVLPRRPAVLRLAAAGRGRGRRPGRRRRPGRVDGGRGRRPRPASSPRRTVAAAAR